jgi:spermidine/putrescine transport system substrate-binding protein
LISKKKEELNMKGIMKKKNVVVKLFSLILVMTMIMTCFTGCQSSDKNSETGYAKSINIMVWEGTYPEEIFDQFEDQYNIKVNISYIVNTDEILAKLLAGGDDADYDFIDLESAYVKPFVDNNLIQKLDFDKIPNAATIDATYTCPPGDENGEYTCSNGTMGYTYIVYNKKTCPIEIDSFQDLADPALKDQICSVNSTISLFGEALASLGYKPDSTTESEYKEAADLWIDIKKNVKVFTGATCYDKLIDGECSVGFMFDYAQLEMYADNPDDYVVPVIPEGYESYSSTWAVPSSSEKVEEAELLMNFLLSNDVFVQRMKYYPMMCGVDGILKQCGEDISTNKAFNLPDDVYQNVWMVPVSDTAIGYMDKYLTEFMSTN